MDKSRLYHIIFEADTTPGKILDIALLIAILASTTFVALESIAPIKEEYSLSLK
ncbi:MAG: hypothetical protein AAF558_02580 [Verrucomicrobiota bacterium]